MRTMPLKNTPARKALAVTIWLQHKHPQAQKTLGRMNTAKRFEHFKAYAKTMVGEKKIREILLSPIDPEKAGKKISDYLIQKNKDPKKALDDLLRIQKEVGNPVERKLSFAKELVRHAKKIKIPKENMRSYIKEINHLVAGTHETLTIPLLFAELELEKLQK